MNKNNFIRAAATVVPFAASVCFFAAFVIGGCTEAIKFILGSAWLCIGALNFSRNKVKK